jgi:hypothetical protein
VFEWISPEEHGKRRAEEITSGRRCQRTSQESRCMDKSDRDCFMSNNIRGCGQLLQDLMFNYSDNFAHPTALDL